MTRTNRPSARLSHGHRRLLRDLEVHYPGIGADLERDTDGVDEADERVVDAPARISLRDADAAPAMFDYQNDLVDQFESVCTSGPGSNIALLALPTGSGKTRTATVALLRLFTTRHVRTALWLAPTRELLSQAVATAAAVWSQYRSAVDLELVRAEQLQRYPDDLECGILFATPQLVASRLTRNATPDADVVVFDEAHHLEAPMFRHVMEEMRRRKRSAVIGLSATPGRAREVETERLADFFQGRLLRSERLDPNPVRVLQRRGILARVGFRDIPVPARNRLPRARVSSSALSFDLDRFRALVRLAVRVSRNSRGLVFTASVNYAHLAAAALRREGVSAKAVSSYSPDNVRREILRDFERGALSIVLNKSLLTTGYDCPAIGHVILATPIQSAIMFEQIVGRASRGPLVGGNATSTVWQFEDHLAMHGLPQSYYRYADYDWRALRPLRAPHLR